MDCLDDLSIFSKRKSNHLLDLVVVLQRCRDYGIFLNPKKSTFVVTEGKLISHIASKEGLKFDLDRVKDIDNI